MKALWFLVIFHFSVFDGSLVRVKTIAVFDTKEECVEVRSEMPKRKHLHLMCTTQPQPDR